MFLAIRSPLGQIGRPIAKIPTTAAFSFILSFLAPFSSSHSSSSLLCERKPWSQHLFIFSPIITVFNLRLDLVGSRVPTCFDDVFSIYLTSNCVYPLLRVFRSLKSWFRRIDARSLPICEQPRRSFWLVETPPSFITMSFHTRSSSLLSISGEKLLPFFPWYPSFRRHCQPIYRPPTAAAVLVLRINGEPMSVRRPDLTVPNGPV